MSFCANYCRSRLLIAWCFPPFGISGQFFLFSVCRYLSSWGHSVCAICRVCVICLAPFDFLASVVVRHLSFEGQFFFILYGVLCRFEAPVRFVSLDLHHLSCMRPSIFALFFVFLFVTHCVLVVVFGVTCCAPFRIFFLPVIRRFAPFLATSYFGVVCRFASLSFSSSLLLALLSSFTSRSLRRDSFSMMRRSGGGEVWRRCRRRLSVCP